MNKITTEHLNKSAYVYIRQSTAEQVKNNVESQRRQYALVDRAKQLGWEDAVVIDDDLGRSGSGGVERPGFTKLLAEVCNGTVGAIFSLEASRLARNGREWHTLLELCSLTGALLVDHDGIYEPNHPNDRLLLGMKGTLSEMEVSTFRQRAQEAIKQKASRGELYTLVAIGYLRSADDRLEKDPNQRIQKVLELVFEKFREFGSIYQVYNFFQQEGVELPSAKYFLEKPHIRWETPNYSRLNYILTNPVYAGVYAYGRTKTRICVKDGRKHVTYGHKQRQQDWTFFMKDHHDGYISWGEYEQNQHVIKTNSTVGNSVKSGAVRKGNALLPGLLRCGHCGRKLGVKYSGNNGKVIRYYCNGGRNNGGRSCIGVRGMPLDNEISKFVLQVLQPLGIQASLTAVQDLEGQFEKLVEQKELALKQAHYEADRIHKQYELVDPENRLVASELESRWNKALVVVKELTEELARFQKERPGDISEEEKEELLALGDDVAVLWDHPSSDPALKKRILRTLIQEIIVHLEGENLRFIVHWEGGDHTEKTIGYTKGRTSRKTDEETSIIIIDLAHIMPDEQIATCLNRLGRRTGTGETWNRSRICSMRKNRGIPVYKEAEREARGEMLLSEVAKELKISEAKVRRLIKDSILPAKQVCPGTPWIINKKNITALEIQRVIQKKTPLTRKEEQLFLPFQ